MLGPSTGQVNLTQFLRNYGFPDEFASSFNRQAGGLCTVLDQRRAGFADPNEP
jgi:hypothetical protein